MAQGTGTGWVETPKGRGERLRRADLAVPEVLSVEALKHRELWSRWVRAERDKAARGTLLKEAGDAGIERAEAAYEALLREGWIESRESLEGGRWQWQGLVWRDLPRLQQLLGVAGREQREAQRRQAIGQAEEWLRSRAASADLAALDPDLLDETTRALEQLAGDRALPLDALRFRLELLRALADWHDAGEQGLRRVFALRAAGDTKAIGAADWRWLEAGFDLERLGIQQFAPMLWLAGDASLAWGERRVDLGALQCVGLPLADLLRADRVLGPVRRYWLVENRASFERQARAVAAGVLLVWMPGRPSARWLEGVAHLLQLAPAPAWISADADPAGIDIARSTGRLWAERGLAWQPHEMGLAQWQSTTQRWPLNAHDRALLQRLAAAGDLPAELRELCEAMQREGRKAEQEAWL